MSDLEFRQPVRADLCCWLAIHTASAMKALAEMPGVIATTTSYDAADIVLVRRSEMIATELENAAAKIRQDIARAHAMNENTE